MTIKKSWKTTSVGVASAVVSAVLLILQQEHVITPDRMALYLSVFNGIMASLGFVAAKDFNITGSPPRDVDEVKTVVQPKQPTQ